MPLHSHNGTGSWNIRVWLTYALMLTVVAYLRGWLRSRSASGHDFPIWRAVSFLGGVSLIWVAMASPLAGLGTELLTAHMLQHLLLMTFAPPLLWLGAPVVAFRHGLPPRFLPETVSAVFRWPPIRAFGRVIRHPAFCWVAASAALVGWHIPTLFALAMRSEVWDLFEQASFLMTGLLFWWPVVQQWVSHLTAPRWSILLYLFLATVPCDILSGFLAFCDRVLYPAYLHTPRRFGISALEDQQCAAALMWTCVTFVYLVPAAIVTMQILTKRKVADAELRNRLHAGVAQRDKRRAEAV